MGTSLERMSRHSPDTVPTQFPTHCEQGRVALQEEAPLIVGAQPSLIGENCSFPQCTSLDMDFVGEENVNREVSWRFRCKSEWHLSPEAFCLVFWFLLISLFRQRSGVLVSPNSRRQASFLFLKLPNCHLHVSVFAACSLSSTASRWCRSKFATSFAALEGGFGSSRSPQSKVPTQSRHTSRHTFQCYKGTFSDIAGQTASWHDVTYMMHRHASSRYCVALQSSWHVREGLE